MKAATLLFLGKERDTAGIAIISLEDGHIIRFSTESSDFATAHLLNPLTGELLEARCCDNFLEDFRVLVLRCATGEWDLFELFSFIHNKK